MFDPQQALLDLLQPGAANQMLFPPSSRYYGIPAATITTAAGVLEIYLQRRFLPPLEVVLSLQQHKVSQGERLDHIAFRYLGDPEQFWRIADANTEMIADRLTAFPGRQLRIPLEAAI
jgi:nucleoid-associated protein YgaU